MGSCRKHVESIIEIGKTFRTHPHFHWNLIRISLIVFLCRRIKFVDHFIRNFTGNCCIFHEERRTSSFPWVEFTDSEQMKRETFCLITTKKKKKERKEKSFTQREK